MKKTINLTKIRRISWDIDLVFNSTWLKKMINKLMLKGKKTLVEHAIFLAFLNIKKKFKKNPVLLFDKILILSKPIVNVVSKRIGKKIHSVPTPITLRKQLIITLSWLVMSIKEQKSLLLSKRIENELISIIQNKESSLIRKRNKHYIFITDNRLNSRFRWS